MKLSELGDLIRSGQLGEGAWNVPPAGNVVDTPPRTSNSRHTNVRVLKIVQASGETLPADAEEYRREGNSLHAITHEARVVVAGGEINRAENLKSLCSICRQYDSEHYRCQICQRSICRLCKREYLVADVQAVLCPRDFRQVLNSENTWRHWKRVDWGAVRKRVFGGRR